MAENNEFSFDDIFGASWRQNYRTPYNGKRLGALFGMIFGVRPGAKSPLFPDEYVLVAADAVETALVTLTPREERVLRMRLGLNAHHRDYTQQQVADHFAVSRFRVREIERKALRKLRHPSRAEGLKVFLESLKKSCAISWLNVQR